MFNKKIVITLTIFLTIIISFGVYVIDIAANGKSTTIVLPVLSTKLVKIDGMTCESCEQALAGAAKKMQGVKSITASATEGNAVVEYDLVKTDIDAVMKEIRKTGYRPISYEDYVHTAKKNVSKRTKESSTTIKCGAGKCGAMD